MFTDYKSMSMLNVTAHLPSGGTYQNAAAWMLVAASIILFVMLIVRSLMSYKKLLGGGYWEPTSIPFVGRGLGYLMDERGPGHLILYFVLFALVFSSAMSFFLS